MKFDFGKNFPKIVNWSGGVFLAGFALKAHSDPETQETMELAGRLLLFFSTVSYVTANIYALRKREVIQLSLMNPIINKSIGAYMTVALVTYGFEKAFDERIGGSTATVVSACFASLALTHLFANVHDLGKRIIAWYRG